MGRPNSSTKTQPFENPLLPPIPMQKTSGSPWSPLFRDIYEPVLKRNHELRRLYADRKLGLEPTDEDWMRHLWPAVFPTTRLSLTTGHVTSTGNGFDQLKNFETLQRSHAGRLVYRVHSFEMPSSGVDPYSAVVVWNVEAAMLVLDLVRDEFELLLNAALAHHRVPQFRVDQRRRVKNLPQFSYDQFVHEGFEHLAEQWDARVPVPPECSWALPLLVEAMLAFPPTVRRIWVEHERVREPTAGESDPSCEIEGWALHYKRDLIEQLKLTIARRLVDDRFSKHALVNADADVSMLEDEWRASVASTWHPQLGALLEPVIPLRSVMTLAASVMNKNLARADDKRARRLLDDIANWVIVRIVGAPAPGRVWVDYRERRKQESLLGALLRPHLAVVDADDWMVANQSNGGTGTSQARQQHAAIWMDLNSLADALAELVTKRSFQGVIATWRPRDDGVCSPVSLLLQHAKLLRRRVKQGGSSYESLRNRQREPAEGGTSVGNDAINTNEGELGAALCWLRRSLNPDEQALFDEVLAGTNSFDALPDDLRHRIEQALSG